MDFYVTASFATALVLLFAVFGLAMPEWRLRLVAASAVLGRVLFLSPALVSFLGLNPARITLFWVGFAGLALLGVLLYRHNRQGRSTPEQ